MGESSREAVPRQRAIVTLMALSIAMIAFLTYVRILGYLFTATDTLTLIETSRVQSPKDLIGILTQPLMAGTQFSEATRVYRPISSLSYALDYFVWRLNPFGYHLTDLTLHMLVSVFAFLLMWFLTGGRKGIAWVSAAVFTSHPILVESVPAIARRQDIIAALFLVLSLIMFLNVAARARRGNWSLIGSVLAYALALGAKESAILLPLIICGYLLVFSSPNGNEDRPVGVGAFRSLRPCLPYLAVTAVYLVWRIYVLRSIGGNLHPPAGFSEVIRLSGSTFKSYFLDLLYPVALRVVEPKVITQAGSSLVAISLLLIFLPVCTKGALMNVRHSSDRMTLKACLVEGLNQLKRLLTGTSTGRIVVFLLIWLLAPLGLFLATRTFSHRNMYISVIPFSAILSIALVEGLRLDVRKLRREQPATGSSWLVYAANGSLVVASGLIIYLLCFSPIVRDYGEWKDSGEISSVVLHRLSQAITDLPDRSTIHIYDLPVGIATYQTKIPHAKSVSYLTDYTIKSWLDLTDPDNRIDVVVENRTVLPTYPRDIDLKITIEPNNNVGITITSDENHATR